MDKLREFIRNHCQKVPLGEDDIDVNMEFFGVKVVGHPSQETLKEFVQEYQDGEFGTNINVLDGKEHNYMNLGAWIGDQGYALMLMALGSHLKLWDLLTPNTLMPFLDQDLKNKMRDMGMISIIHKV